jgi:2'-5' RNA ligase
MRTFLAIDVPDDVKDAIQENLHPLMQEYRNINWTPLENYHITLHFFGNVPDEKIKPLSDRIEDCLFDAESFPIKLRSASIFMRNSIILHVNTYRSKKAEEVVKKIHADLGINEVRSFVPHISVARHKIPSKQQYLLLKKKLMTLSFEEEFLVDTVHLYESVLKKTHPTYKKVRSFSLINE